AGLQAGEIPDDADCGARARGGAVVLGRPGLQLVRRTVMRAGGWLLTVVDASGSPPHRDVYEHPWPIRLTHWLNAAVLVVMAGSGLQILTAFPAFGPKIPQHDLVDVPGAVRIGGWLGGALQWHFTFM